jgi:hypothetical protein
MTKSRDLARLADVAQLMLDTRLGQLVYDRWADVRRAELNLVIARQTAEMLEARSEAGTAFGRLQALQGLAKRLEERR